MKTHAGAGLEALSLLAGFLPSLMALCGLLLETYQVLAVDPVPYTTDLPGKDVPASATVPRGGCRGLNKHFLIAFEAWSTGGNSFLATASLIKRPWQKRIQALVGKLLLLYLVLNGSDAPVNCLLHVCVHTLVPLSAWFRKVSF